jgi:hypothetical protein
MFENPFHLSAYVPKQNINAADLIEATLLQSLWISNFKKSLVGMTISNVLARWFKNTLHHSTKETRTNPSYRPALANGHCMHYQEFCTNKSYNKKIHEFKGMEMIPYRYPNCLTGEAWDAYANNPFNLSTRNKFLSTISLSCTDKKKDTKMMHPYALALENVTTDMGPISSHGQRKIDARHYNKFLLTPGIVYHMTSKIQNSHLNDCYRNPFEVGIINFITQFGNYMRKTPYLKNYGAYSKYVDMMVTYINGCTGKEQIIPVTMFLVMLYNACFMYQSDKRSNLLITALDTFDLGASVDHEKFMNTLSESNH